MDTVLAAIVSPVVQYLIDPAKKHLDYFITYKKHVGDMSTTMMKLDGDSADVERRKKDCTYNNLVTPNHVQDWLDQVKKIQKDVKNIEKDGESISSNGNGCFSMKTRYQAGKKASEITKKIEGLISNNPQNIWNNNKKSLADVNSRKPSTPQKNFKSRDRVLKEVLKFLQQDQKTQVIALCGMGGVGKTMMMKQLKEDVARLLMYPYIVEVVIGEKDDSFSIQQAIAESMETCRELTEKTIIPRANLLRIRFEEMSKEGDKVLVILDDVRNMVELNDIGLSSLPNGFKLLLTSRDERICKQIASKTKLVLEVVRVCVLEELEARNLFRQITGVSKEKNPQLYQIGCDIVKKCSYLPLAIEQVAATLKNEEGYKWRDKLICLKNNELDENIRGIFQMSYNNLHNVEDKEILLLCSLFPNYSNIPIEDVTRYAWGLNLLNEVSTLGIARDRTKACVDNLKNANLLIESDYLGCVKMYDLVHSFVVGTLLGGDQAYIINHGDMPKNGGAKMSESCTRISLTCTSMSPFPIDVKYPNLSLLKLLHGEKSLVFPENFYGNMEKVEVIAYEKIQYPLLPTSQCLSNLRTLCLYQCLLTDDFSFLEYLINLEVLSFAHCHIRKLPSTIGKLKNLKLLDLTGCVDLRIDNGVLKKLKKLEELYMGVADQKAITFIDGIYKELVKRSKNLSALEIEFVENNAHLQKMSFKKLERFKISMGCCLQKNIFKKLHSFENTLKLVINKIELLESKLNRLFQKTEVLHLQVNGINDLEDVLEDPSHPTFYNLRVLDVYNCENLTYLFTVRVASGLERLERLTISWCSVMKVLVHSVNSEAGVIKFPKLKFLSLDTLPNLVSLCNMVNVIELPQLVELKLNGLPKVTSIYPENKSTTSSMSSNGSALQPFLNKEVEIPKLEILYISKMKNMKEIWPCQYTGSKEVNISMLRYITVQGCDSLVNLFPSNMMLPHYLEKLEVRNCSSIEVLFTIDLGGSREIEEVNTRSSCCLRNITVVESGKLREVWRIKGANNLHLLFHYFQDVEEITITSCKSFRNVYTPTTIDFDMKALRLINIDGSEVCEQSRRNNDLVESSPQINVISRVDANIPNVAFPSYLTNSFHHLQELTIRRWNGVKVVFEIASACSRELTTTPNNQQPPLLPNLKDLHLSYMEEMSHVWKCNWNKLLILQKQQLESSFQNLTDIELHKCKSIKYLFSPFMAKLLSSLKNVNISDCDGIEKVVDENEDTTTSTSPHTSIDLFPRFCDLLLHDLKSLTGIGGAKCSIRGIALWSLCQYSSKIRIFGCHALLSVIPSHEIGKLEKLEELEISRCESMKEVFEMEGVNISSCHNTNVGDESGDIGTRLTNLFVLSYLKVLKINHCDLLEHIFVFSTLESLCKLNELTIENCKKMKVIVKEDEERTTTSKVVVFHCLKSLTLCNLPNLGGFFLGMNKFEWPLLDKVKIYGCPQMNKFTSGHSSARKLNYIHTGFSKYGVQRDFNFVKPNKLDHDLNFQVETILQQAPFHSLCLYSEGIPWHFDDMIEIDMDDIHYVEKIIPSNELLQLQKLKKIQVKHCNGVVEVFDTLERTNSGLNESTSLVKLPSLRELELWGLLELKYIWKSNKWIVFKFSTLTRVLIHNCQKLQHVFTCSMVSSLLQLEELHISHCKSMEVIVKEEEEADAKVNEIMLPCLKSLKLVGLQSVKGFCLGNEHFVWNSLDTLEIKKCPNIKVFNKGNLTTPKLKVIETIFGRCSVRGNLNSFIETKQKEKFEF